MSKTVERSSVGGAGSPFHLGSCERARASAPGRAVAIAVPPGVIAGSGSRRRVRRPPFPAAAALLVAVPLAAQPAGGFVSRLLEGAERQVGVTVIYDGSYRPLAYPGGDVPLERGVCTDVLVRAYRHAGIDLQVLVHEDLKRAFGSYPKTWGLTRPDRSIDHRRVPNLATFFARHGETLPLSRTAADYRPGEIVTWRLPSGLPHVGLVSARTDDGRPLVIHNVGAGTVFEDVLFAWPVTGRYRYPRSRTATSSTLPLGRTLPP